MPKVEPKFIQKELETGQIRPFYWLFGSEQMKIRELHRRIQKAAHQGEAPNDFNTEKIDGSQMSSESIVDSLQSFSMMGGVKLVIVKNADEIKDLDGIVDFLKALDSPTKPGLSVDLFSVAVFISKSFDGRKKTSKAIQDLGTTVPCEAVTEQDREPWIAYLAKRRGIQLSLEEATILRSLDPWSLDIVDQELGKIELVTGDGVGSEMRRQVLMTGIDPNSRDDFIDALFCRDLRRGLKWVPALSEDMDVQLPILGLIAWNIRHLKMLLLEQETRSSGGEKRNPYLQRNLDRWKQHWTVSSLQNFEQGLFEIDFSLKNTRLMGKGLWTDLLISNQGGPNRVAS